MATPGDLNELAEQLADILGGKATVEDGVISVTIDRNLDVEIKGVPATAPIVQQIEVNFQPITGNNPRSDFLNLGEAVLLTEETQPFLRSLSANGLPVTALHNHWLYQDPDIWYMHWLEVMPPVMFARLTAQALATLGH